MAVTATATQSDISALQDALRCHVNKVGLPLFVDPFSRPNLHLIVVPKDEGTGSYTDLLNSVRGQGCGIVYVWRRVDALAVADALERAGVRTAAYHGQLDRGVRDNLSQRWRQGVFIRAVPCSLACVTFGVCFSTVN